MSPDTPTTSKICPTCGTRLNENATRCLVCGRNFSPAASAASVAKALQTPRMPEITLTLPVAMGLMVVILAIGAAIVFAVLRGTGRVVEPTPTITPTLTQTVTLTPTITLTSTPQPTATPLPPLEYVVKPGDTCISIAFFFNVTVQSVVLLNNLPADCSTLFPGQKLLVPQPTPTPSPMPSATLDEAQKTEAACQTVTYKVNENDTLSGIARSYSVSMQTIKEYNGLATDMVFSGQTIIIPLCERLPTPGPTPTATPPPPYLAPNLLLPADGSAFMSANETITLQWSSVGTLRQNEAYAVIVEDVTDGSGRKLTEYVTDTKFIIPSSFRPTGNVPHVIRWTVMAVRQSGSSQGGQAVWEPAGASSTPRVFSWWGAGAGTSAP